MSTSIISRRYARALINLASRADQIEAVGQGLDGLAEALETSPQLAGLIAEPRVLQAQKDAVLAELMRRAGVAPLVESFVRLVSEKRRAGLLVEIRRIYHELADARLGRAMARVTVAGDLTADQQERLRTALEGLSGKQITLEVEVDPAVLGGVVARIGSTVWDGSLRGRLESIRQSITGG